MNQCESVWTGVWIDQAKKKSEPVWTGVHRFTFFTFRFIFSSQKWNITRNQALCMFYAEKYTEVNVNLLSKRLESYGEIEICYETNPLKPVLVTKTRIWADPFSFKRYLNATTSTSVEAQEKTKLSK
jgi:hypothetical protein